MLGAVAFLEHELGLLMIIEKLLVERLVLQRNLW